MFRSSLCYTGFSVSNMKRDKPVHGNTRQVTVTHSRDRVLMRVRSAAGQRDNETYGTVFAEIELPPDWLAGGAKSRVDVVLEAIAAAARAGAVSSMWCESEQVCLAVWDQLAQDVGPVRVEMPHLDHDELMWTGQWTGHDVMLVTKIAKVTP